MKKVSFLLIFLISCAPKNIKTEKHDLDAFSISLPNDWKVNEVQGIDSKVREIVTSDGDTIKIDYGFYSGTFEETEPRIYPVSMIKWFVERKIDTTGMVFLDKKRIDESDREKFRKHKIAFDTINGYSVKITEPKFEEAGVTEVYFDSLGTGGIGNIQLAIRGINLKKANIELLVNSAKTIAIKEK